MNVMWGASTANGALTRVSLRFPSVWVHERNWRAWADGKHRWSVGWSSWSLL